MSDHESVDVTSNSFFTESSPKPVSKCGYCDCEKEGLPVFHCESCGKWVHTSCLHSGSPSSILFDNFYIFKCVRCAENGKESFRRMKMTWNQVTNLALFNIAQCSPGKDGFHKWKETIGAFIDKHWDLLFESYKRKTNTWINTIAATLSAGNPHQFTSGYGFFKESGWWRLTNPSIPPEYTPNTNDIKYKDARSKKSKSPTCALLPDVGKLEGLRKRPYSSSVLNASQLKEKRSKTQALQRNLDTQEESHVDQVHEDSPPSFTGCASPISSMLSSPRSVTSMTCKSDITVDDALPLAALSDDSDLDQEKMTKERSRSFANDFSPVSENSSMLLTQHTSVRQKALTCRGNALEGSTLSRSIYTPELKKKIIKVARTNVVAQQIADSSSAEEMSLYEEQAILRKLESYGSILKDVPEAYRLRRKLLLRQNKRRMNLPVTSYEAKVRQSLVHENSLLIDERIPQQNKWSVMMPFPVVHQCHKILDRFQRKATGNAEMQLYRTFHQRLIGRSHDDIPPSVVSPYTKRVLKPYIRRDYESRPTKLRVLDDIVARYRKRYNTEDAQSTRCSVPIDFCYIQPLHVAAINAACHHFFWPGIDISETLQYPDFSIVALYKKMVIGFAFMVPDVSFNEAYISFLFVHPDWQGAGIGTFMVYHLLQTCMGKEVTLHVSASNPAMLLYQKFGFKPEKFIADFYDKYHPMDSSECKHAFFLRLRR